MIKLILILIIIFLFITIYLNLSNLNKPILPCKQLEYNSTNDFNGNNIKENSKYLLNYVISCYNDVCNYPLFKSLECCIYHLKASINVFYFKTINNAGLVYIFNDKVIVAFRGTHFKGDEIIDSEIKLYNYPGTTINVHKGFHNYFLGLKDQLFNIIKDNLEKKIFITGHSLGASVALVASYELLNTFSNLNLNIYLFACPKTGNLDFVNFFNNLNIYSIINYFDIVPESPELIEKMYSVRPIYIFGIENNSDIKNHSIEVYNNGIDFIEKLNFN
jgi:triacylglycerol lipase